MARGRRHRNFETGTRNTMMWRVPWATGTAASGHTDQIVEMLDVGQASLLLSPLLSLRRPHALAGFHGPPWVY